MMNAMMNKEEILQHLKMVSWDIAYTPEQLYGLLNGEVEDINGFTRENLYAKIVNTFNWHTVRKIIPQGQIKEVLSDQVIQSLFPRSLREKYRNVRKLL